MSEPFEIADYTTVSPFEKLVAAIETILREWGLYGFSQLSEPPTPQSREFTHDDTDYILSLVSRAERPGTDPRAGHYPRAMAGYMDPTADFPHKAPPLSRWFGLPDYLVAEPASASTRRAAYPDAARLLSAVTIALDYIAAAIPVFVPVESSDWHAAYIGYMGHPAVSLSFQSSAEAAVPVPAAHLDGLLHAFDAEFGARPRPTNTARTSTTNDTATNEINDTATNEINDTADRSSDSKPLISVRYTFERSSAWYTWKAGRPVSQPRPGYDPEPAANWGPGPDPLAALNLSTTWPQFPRDTFVDSRDYSDLEPMAAPLWTLRVEPARPVEGALTTALHDSLLAAKDARGVDAIDTVLSWCPPHDDTPTPAPASANNAAPASSRRKPLVARLAQLTAPGPVHTLDSPRDVPPPSRIAAIVAELFAPAASPRHPLAPPPTVVDPICGSRALKAAPRGSLVAELASAVLGMGLCAVVSVWDAFVKELRSAWESATPLPAMPRLPHITKWDRPSLLGQTQGPGPRPQTSLFPPSLHIDTRASLLAQKVEIIALAVLTHRFYAHLAHTDGAEYTLPVDYTLAPAEVAFDASDDGDGDSNNHGDGDDDDGAASSSSTSTSFFDAVETPGPVRRGALWPMVPERHLLGVGPDSPPSADTRIYVPLTPVQEFMTEDLMEELEEVLFSLGTTPKAAAQRAEIQSASLYADMCAFQAANPGAVLADFVRWHSPRDYDEDTQALSPRFDGTPGNNLWLRLWAKAAPRPAWDQAPLFAYEKQAEHALAFLEHLAPHHLMTHLIPCIWSVATEALLADPIAAALPAHTAAAAATYATAVAESGSALAHHLADIDISWLRPRSAYTPHAAAEPAPAASSDEDPDPAPAAAPHAAVPGSHVESPPHKVYAALSPLLDIDPDADAHGSRGEAHIRSIMAAFGRFEADMGLAASTLYKLVEPADPELESQLAALADDILTAGAGLVPPSLRPTVLAAFTDKDTGSRPLAATREFIIRQRKPLPYVDGVPLGQRMYVIITDDTFRVATVKAVSE